MRINLAVTLAVAAALALMPAAVRAQSSSINTYSPYTFYGIGDISLQGPSQLRAMGGTGVAYFDPSGHMINTLNPATAAFQARQSFMLSVDVEGSNHYLKNSETKSSYNAFNIKNIAVQFPLARGVGFGISVSPYSSVGYRAEQIETDDDIVTDLGRVTYKYEGEGDVNLAKASLGVMVTKRLFVGAEAQYYFGNIQRHYWTEITPITGSGSYYATEVTRHERYSRMQWGVGAMYNVIAKPRRVLTVGATYNPGGKMNPEISRESINYVGDTIRLGGAEYDNFKLPQTITAGLFYHTQAISVGVDYTYKGWAGQNSTAETGRMKFINTNTISAGLQWTPDRTSVRRRMNRWDYRIGVRYSDYYMQFDGQKMSDKAVSLGIGIPLKQFGVSKMNVNFEAGQRGTTKAGLIKENYFKVGLGFTLFDSGWFMKWLIN